MERIFAVQNNVPYHVFVIPDGNRRWAKSRNLAPWLGHLEGVKKFYEISETAFNFGIKYFTFWAASEDNLSKRSELEVKFLINLINREISENICEKLFGNNIRLRVLGRWKDIFSDSQLSDCIRSLEEKTAIFNDRHLTILLGYSGKTEIVEAVKMVCGLNVDCKNATFDFLKNISWTHDLPSVDLEIRTGEEKDCFSHRSSSSLPFLATDSVCHNTGTLWPDFSKSQFSALLKEYAAYERRFGA